MPAQPAGVVLPAPAVNAPGDDESYAAGRGAMSKLIALTRAPFHVLLRVQGVLIVGVVLCIVLLQRQISFARKRAGRSESGSNG